MTKIKKIPLRQCICCKEMKPKKELLRIVKNSDNEISLDLTSKKSGRGAYICDNQECIDKLIKTKGLNRVFQMDVPKEVYEKIKEDFSGKK